MGSIKCYEFASLPKWVYEDAKNDEKNRYDSATQANYTRYEDAVEFWIKIHVRVVFDYACVCGHVMQLCRSYLHNEYG